MGVSGKSVLVQVTVVAALVGGCGSPDRFSTPPAPETTSASQLTDPAELRATLASLLIVGVTDFDSARAALEQGVGGIFIPSWADPALLTEPGRDIAALKEAVGRDFDVAIDFEGGRVQRHAEVLGGSPAARTLGDSKTADEVRDAARAVGERLRARGITVDFAPVADVDTAGLDIVGDRAFGNEAAKVGQYAGAFASGLEDAGVDAVVKHFPGHGAASGDTHLGPAVTPPVDQLARLDGAAFAQLLTEHPDVGVMMGHLNVPGLSTGDLPATVDPAVYEYLRSGAYGGPAYTGVVYTDDLSGMAAITDRMSTPQAVLAALKAGADRALWSTGDQVQETVDLLEQAVSSGELPIERVVAARDAGE